MHKNENALPSRMLLMVLNQTFCRLKKVAKIEVLRFRCTKLSSQVFNLIGFRMHFKTPKHIEFEKRTFNYYFKFVTHVHRILS